MFTTIFVSLIITELQVEQIITHARYPASAFHYILLPNKQGIAAQGPIMMNIETLIASARELGIEVLIRSDGSADASATSAAASPAAEENGQQAN